MIAATAGMGSETYARGKRNLYPLEELLRPWEVTAHQSGFTYEEPFLVYGNDDFDDADRARVGREFAERIGGWTTTRPRD
jgi:putative NADPH-quinone reductase